MLTNPFIKKFLGVYLGAVILVALYFLIKTLFTQETEIEFKQFNTKPMEQSQESKEELHTPTPTKYLLLPKKD